jgi:hypothetical protein
MGFAPLNPSYRTDGADADIRMAGSQRAGPRFDCHRGFRRDDNYSCRSALIADFHASIVKAMSSGVWASEM